MGHHRPKERQHACNKLTQDELLGMIDVEHWNALTTTPGRACQYSLYHQSCTPAAWGLSGVGLCSALFGTLPTLTKAGGRGASWALGAASRSLRFFSTVALMSSSSSRVLAFFMLLTLMRRRCVSM